MSTKPPKENKKTKKNDQQKRETYRIWGSLFKSCNVTCDADKDSFSDIAALREGNVVGAYHSGE